MPLSCLCFLFWICFVAGAWVTIHPVGLIDVGRPPASSINPSFSLNTLRSFFIQRQSAVATNEHKPNVLIPGQPAQPGGPRDGEPRRPHLLITGVRAIQSRGSSQYGGMSRPRPTHTRPYFRPFTPPMSNFTKYVLTWAVCFVLVHAGGGW